MAGTVTAIPAVDVGRGVRRHAYEWLSDASGDVNGDSTTIVLPAGELMKVEFVPGATSPAIPLNNYDVTVLDQYDVWHLR